MKETQSAMTVEINFESIKISTDEWLKNTIMVADDPLIWWHFLQERANRDKLRLKNMIVSHFVSRAY